MNSDRQLLEWLGGHRGTVRGGSPEDHPDIETLSKHATGQLVGNSARAVTEHLLVCDDGRCVAFVRSVAEDVDAAAAILYPADGEPGESKGMRHRTFLCRELLWQHFEEMARELNAPIDQLVEEAMQTYARQRAGAGPSGSVDIPPPPAPRAPAAYDYSAPESAPDMERTAARPQLRLPREAATMEAPALRPQGATPAPAAMLRAPMMPAGGTPMPPGGMPPLQRPFTQPIDHAIPAPPPKKSGGTARMPPTPPPLAPPPPPPASSAAMGRRPAPPPLPSSPAMMGPAASTGELSLTYRGQSSPVTKDHFILGRSKTNADLVLDDSNVSRQHAAIERAGDAWYIVDLGSTNGIYIAGRRVTRQRLEDGDVIEITTHQIFVTLR